MSKPIRFGIKDVNDNQSGVYRVWTSKSDVYLAVRVLGGDIKVSLHESKECQFSFTSNFIKGLDIPNKSRHIEKWERKPNIGQGITLAFRIVIPQSELRERIVDQSKVKWIENSEESTCLEVALIFTEKGINVSGWPGKKSMGTQLLKSYKLPNGETLWLVYYKTIIDDKLKEQLNEYRKVVRDKLLVKRVDSTNIRGFLFGDESDDSRKFIDIALW